MERTVQVIVRVKKIQMTLEFIIYQKIQIRNIDDLRTLFKGRNQIDQLNMMQMEGQFHCYRRNPDHFKEFSIPKRDALKKKTLDEKKEGRKEDKKKEEQKHEKKKEQKDDENDDEDIEELQRELQRLKDQVRDAVKEAKSKFWI
ncbi:MAG: hypothetical protein EZS28_013204 [Streblomastix strix]|uniref:PBZ-type domain-containing protein n=1 Tax=Streblomastix strix TaxID=222440 RepID=A0A5J4W8M8_9EUKA|nr:MAG: hypothetical protein EZS28_013204 [Streblomastix strix]